MKEWFWGQTYEATEELKDIQPLLNTAMSYQSQFKEFIIPFSFWKDQFGWLYIRWHVIDQIDDKPVWRYRFDTKGGLDVEEIKVNLSRVERLRGKDANAPAILITGDTHREV